MEGRAVSSGRFHDAPLILVIECRGVYACYGREIPSIGSAFGRTLCYYAPGRIHGIFGLVDARQKPHASFMEGGAVSSGGGHDAPGILVIECRVIYTCNIRYCSSIGSACSYAFSDDAPCIIYCVSRLVFTGK